jgi:hypothetical protein
MTSSFIHVPSSKGFIGMKKNAQKTNWLPHMLMALGGQGNKQEKLLDLLVYIDQNNNYNAMWEEAIRSNGLLLPTLVGVVTQAIQSTCNMNKFQMRQLHGCLKVKLRSAVFIYKQDYVILTRFGQIFDIIM